MTTVGTWLEEMVRRLCAVSETAVLDAQVLLAHLMGKTRTWIVAHPEAEVPQELEESLFAALQRLEAGEPLAYLLGYREFYGRRFEVTPQVLIPRPETELLVERALNWLRRNPRRRRAADVGTGSGCIAVSLAAEIPDLQVLATDISLPALRVARRNAIKHGVQDRIRWLQCDLLPPPPSRVSYYTRFDLICANLPYIPSPLLPELAVARYEPLLALNGGKDGLDLIRRLLQRVPEWIAPGGLILLEIEASQGPTVFSMAYDVFSSAQIHLYPDLASHDRLLEILVQGE